jgi:hypothetical protein
MSARPPTSRPGVREGVQDEEEREEKGRMVPTCGPPRKLSMASRP